MHKAKEDIEIYIQGKFHFDLGNLAKDVKVAFLLTNLNLDSEIENSIFRSI